jgi:hypothetical protein
MKRREFITLIGGAAVFVPQEWHWSQAASVSLTRLNKPPMPLRSDRGGAYGRKQ